MKDSEEHSCYDCAYARYQGGSCHLICPHITDFDPRLHDELPCNNFLLRKVGDKPSTINAFMVWSGNKRIYPEGVEVGFLTNFQAKEEPNRWL